MAGKNLLIHPLFANFAQTALQALPYLPGCPPPTIHLINNIKQNENNL